MKDGLHFALITIGLVCVFSFAQGFSRAAYRDFKKWRTTRR